MEFHVKGYTLTLEPYAIKVALHLVQRNTWPQLFFYPATLEKKKQKKQTNKKQQQKICWTQDDSLLL